MDGATQSPRGRVVMVGAHKIDGRSKGTYLSIDTPDQVAVEVGVDGEGTFIENGDGSATITISLTPSSRSNLVLSTYFDTKLAFPVSIFEKNGTTVGGCARARITKKAPVAWTDGAESRVWTLVTTSWWGVVGDMRLDDLASVDESSL